MQRTTACSPNENYLNVNCDLSLLVRKHIKITIKYSRSSALLLRSRSPNRDINSSVGHGLEQGRRTRKIRPQHEERSLLLNIRQMYRKKEQQVHMQVPTESL